MQRWWWIGSLLLAALGGAYAAPGAPTGGFPAAPARAVAVVPARPHHVVAATDDTVYESHDAGGTWSVRHHLSGGRRATTIAINPADPSEIVLGTTGGAYGILRDTVRWRRLFRGSTHAERHCTDVAFHPSRAGTAVLGTQDGAFITQDGGRRWERLPTPRAARRVVRVAFDRAIPLRLYLLTTTGLWTGDLRNGAWRRMAPGMRAEEDAEEVEEAGRIEETGEDPGLVHPLSALAVDARDPARLYVAGLRGVRVSGDAGTTWRWISRTGLPDADVTALHAATALYAVTVSGVARYDPVAETWSVVTDGRRLTRVHDLAVAGSTLWIAAEEGLHRVEVASTAFPEPAPPTPQELLANFTHEPSIRQVQEAAIRYAEVFPEKIRRWRRRAALQALLPSVKVGADANRSRDDRVDEGSFPDYQIFEIRDRDVGYDVSVTWNLAELIWNNDQTLIDVRSKLMVQLRNDIVDEVTRLYFERRRLQVALLLEPPEASPAGFERAARIEELTALIDGLTGGEFSRAMVVPHVPAAP